MKKNISVVILVILMMVIGCGGGSSGENNDYDLNTDILTGLTPSLDLATSGWRCDNGIAISIWVFALDDSAAILDLDGSVIMQGVYTTEGCFSITMSWTNNAGNQIDQVWQLDSYNESDGNATFQQSEPQSGTYSCEQISLL